MLNPEAPKILIIALILSLSPALPASVPFAAGLASSSISYSVPVYVMGSAGGSLTSTSYQVFGSGSGLNVGFKSNSSYLMREGFIPAGYALSVMVLSIDPNSGYNTGKIRINKMAGVNFLQGADVRLRLTGEADIVATDITLNASHEISCVFDLAGKKDGFWNLRVTNPDNSTGLLPRAFQVKTWYDIKLVLNTPNPFNPPLESTQIMYKLEKDTDVMVVIFSVTAELLWKRSYPAGFDGGKAGDNVITWSGLSDFNEYVSNGVYLAHVIEKSSGRTLARGKIAVIRK
jgi:hypothetical protein